MNRRRKTTLREVKPKRLDSLVVLFAHVQTDETHNSWHRWRHRLVTLRSAQQMVADDQAYVVERRHKNQKLVMYREKFALKPAQTSPCTLTMGTMEAVAANALGFTLSAGQAANVEKFVMWPFDAPRSDRQPAIRAVTIRPRVTQGDINRADAAVRRAIGPQTRNRDVRSKSRVFFPDIAQAAA